MWRWSQEILHCLSNTLHSFAYAATLHCWCNKMETTSHEDSVYIGMLLNVFNKGVIIFFMIGTLMKILFQFVYEKYIEAYCLSLVFTWHAETFTFLSNQIQFCTLTMESKASSPLDHPKIEMLEGKVRFSHFNTNIWK